MKLVRMIVLLSALGGIGWLATEAIDVHATDEAVEITIDRHRLREAGGQLGSKSRSAVREVGRALRQAGETMEEEHHPGENEIFSR